MGGNEADGDVMLLWNPQLSLTLQPAGGPTWEAHRPAHHEVADEQDCGLLDLGGRWTDYATGNARDLLADTIHRTDTGTYDIAPAVHQAVLAGASV